MRVPRFAAPFLVPLLAILLACAGRVPPSESVFAPHAPWQHPAAPEDNQRRLRYYHQVESGYYRSAQALPGLCLALSGGGMRSASFSIGVLSALHTTGTLEHFDVASSISGGGYALSWYLVQHRLAARRDPAYDPRVLDAALFDEQGEHQEFLRDHFELFSFPIGTREGFSESWLRVPLDAGKTGLQLGAALGLTLLSIPVNLFANGLFGWRVNTAPVRPLYENSIERAFHAEPDESNLRPGFGIALNGVDDPVLFGELHWGLEDLKTRGHHLPYPVFGVNVNFSSGPDAGGTDRANRLYEFSPLREGADPLGWRKSVHGATTVGRAVAISGAAWDSEALIEGAPGVLASAANLDLGYRIPNPLTRGPEAPRPVPWWYWLSPFPVYFGKHWNYDLGGVAVRLSDGGHTENLGVFPLARRICDHIVIVDATQDRYLAFEAYSALKRVLATELDMQLRSAAIDPWIAARRAVEVIADEGWRQERGDSSLPSWGAPDPERAQRVHRSLLVLHRSLAPSWRGSPPQPSWQTDDAALRQALALQYRKLAADPPVHPDRTWKWIDPQYTFDGKRPVVAAAIDVPSGAASPNTVLGVTYVKLSLHPGGCTPSPVGQPAYRSATTCDYWLEQWRRRFGPPFPHETTADIDYSPLQYRAMRDLGRDIVCFASRQPAVERTGTIFDPARSFQPCPP